MSIEEAVEQINISFSEKKSTDKNIHALPYLFRKDKCLNGAPFHDFKTFQDELSYTEQQLIQYFPKKHRQTYQSSNNFTKYLSYALFSGNVMFVLGCHKISILNKMLGSLSWKMFIFKVLSFTIPLYYLNQLSEQSYEEANKILYQNIKANYRKYKRTGDITLLNSQIVLLDSHFDTAFISAQDNHSSNQIKSINRTDVVK